METDKVKPECELTHEDSKTLIRKKVTWFADSFIIALFLSFLFSGVIALASDDRLNASAYPYVLLMALGITGTVYRLKDFDER